MRWFEKNTYGLVTQLVKGTGLILLLFLDVDRNGDVVDVILYYFSSMIYDL